MRPLAGRIPGVTAIRPKKTVRWGEVTISPGGGVEVQQAMVLNPRYPTGPPSPGLSPVKGFLFPFFFYLGCIGMRGRFLASSIPARFDSLPPH